jgi:hypothetical protein
MKSSFKQLKGGGRSGLLAVVVAVSMSVAGLAIPTGGMAHHSFAMFDRNKQISVKGTVKEFQFTNPHVFIQLMVPGAQGPAQEWSIEGGSPNMLYRQGWDNATFKAGDQISIVINPLKDGGRGGNFVFATLPDGKSVGNMNARPPG